MSTETNHMINFAELAGAQDYTGTGPATLLPFTGDTKVKLLKIEVDSSKAGNGLFNVAMEVNDTFEGKAVTGVLYGTVLVNGRDNTEKKDFNAKRQLDAFLRSVGWSRQRIEDLAKQGTTITAAQLAADIMKSNGGAPIAYVSVRDREYQGTISSDASNFITAERYEQSKGRKMARVLQPTRSNSTSNGVATQDVLGAIA